MMNKSAGDFFAQLLELMRTLRGPKGCPWNRQQDFESLKSYLQEECHELLEAVNSASKSTHPTAEVTSNLRDELGDLLLQIVFLGCIAEEKGWFKIEEIPQSISEKIIRRHPHVFGEKSAKTPKEVAKLWEEVKKSEKKKQPLERQSALAGVPHTMPGLLRAQKVGEKAAANGFDWNHTLEVLTKVEEEIQELKDLVHEKDHLVLLQAKLKHELGDILFSICNLARFLNISAEDSLHQGIERFQSRFFYIEQSLAQNHQTLASTTRHQLESLWEEAKGKEVSDLK